MITKPGHHVAQSSPAGSKPTAAPTSAWASVSKAEGGGTLRLAARNCRLHPPDSVDLRPVPYRPLSALQVLIMAHPTAEALCQVRGAQRAALPRSGQAELRSGRAQPVGAAVTPSPPTLLGGRGRRAPTRLPCDCRGIQSLAQDGGGSLGSLQAGAATDGGKKRPGPGAQAQGDHTSASPRPH